jgi:hypothetical protein
MGPFTGLQCGTPDGGFFKPYVRIIQTPFLYFLLFQASGYVKDLLPTSKAKTVKGDSKNTPNE